MKKDPPVAQNLIRARQLVNHSWIQGSFCKDAQGHIAEPEHADSYCCLAAIAKVTGRSSLGAVYTPEARYLARAIKRRQNPFAIVAFNDDPGTDKVKVLKAFTRAITLARKASCIATSPSA